MPTGRSTRILIAAMLFIVALFMMMNYVVEARPIVDWWLPLLLLIIGIVITQADRLRRAEAAAPPAAGPVVYSVREYTFEAANTPALAGPEQAGEVNVREPRDEVQSQPIIEAPETMTPPAEPVEEEPAEPVISAPETETPPAPEPEVVEETLKPEDERAVDDFETGGAFAPPSSMEGVLNPPTESDSVPGAVIQHETPIQEHDPAAHMTPLTRITEPPRPDETQAERLEKDGSLIQPADTAENEFQDGEQVAANQPTRSAPTPTTTTGEGAGEGQGPIEPQKQAVLDTTAAPVQPHSQEGVDASSPDVADEVLSDRETPATAEGLAPSDRIQPTPAAKDATSGGPDDLTAIVGIGPKMQKALRTAGITTYTQLAGASEEDLRAAIEAAGMRLAPTLSTWSKQAGFLARGDRAGFEAMLNAMRSEAATPDELDEE